MNFKAKIPGKHPVSVGDSIVGHLFDVILTVDDGREWIYGGTEARPTGEVALVQRRPSTGELNGSFSIPNMSSCYDALSATYGLMQREPPEAYIRLGQELVQIYIVMTDAGKWLKQSLPFAEVRCLMRDVSRFETVEQLRAIGASEIEGWSPAPDPKALIPWNRY